MRLLPSNIIGFWLVLLLMQPAAHAQQLAFRHLTVENGLSQNAVLSIAQDHQGFIWAATSNGLNRYDGYRFKVYQYRATDSSTLSSNSILSILSDSKKNIWIGTYNGLNKYLPGADRFLRIKPTVKTPLTYFCIYEDKKGNIWAGTNAGLYRINTADNNKPELIDFAEQGNAASIGVRAVYEDRSGNFWVGTTTGLYRIRKSGNRSEIQLFRHQQQDVHSLSSDFITAIEEDRQGRIWIGTHTNGLNQYDGRTGQFKRFLHQGPGTIIHNNIRKLLVDKDGRVWVGTQEGISILDEEGQVLNTCQQDDDNPESLSQNSVYSLYEDRSGNIWAGTYFGGLNYTFAVNTPFSILRKKDQSSWLNNNVISSIVEDEKKNLWIGTEGGGLNYYDRSKGSFKSYKQIPGNPGSIGSNLVKVVYRDWQGKIWAGTHGGGLNLYDPEKNEFRKFLFNQNDAILLNEEVVGIYEDSKGRFWVGTTFGIKLFHKVPQGLEPVNTPFTLQSPFNTTANVFYEDDKQRLWVACSDGLYMLEGEQFRKISADLVNCIHESKQSQLWFGIQQGGLASFDENSEKLNYFNRPEKIGNRNIIGILEDDQQNLWLSSDNGLLKFNPRQDLLQIFTVSDGLAGNAFNNNSFFRDSKGEFFFGGFNGITHFFPEKIQSNLKAGNIVLTGVKLFNGPVEPGDASGLLKENIANTSVITLRHNQDILTLEFALLNFIKSNKNSYAYKLEGYDKDWLYTRTPSASYTNLPSGDYNFLVKGANNDGVWSEPVSIKVNVLPPFWLTWWAYCLYILAAGGIVFLALRYFLLGALLKKEEELHQVKLNFFTNISHEIRTHLTLIMAPVERMLDTDDTTSFFRQQLNSVRQNANRLLKLVNELMDFRKAETGNLKLLVHEQDLMPFLEEVYNSFRDICIQKKISASLISNADSIPLYFDAEQLEKVFFNLLTNAIKFTPENGRIWMEIKEKEKEVIISITDDGRGIAPEFLDKVFTNFFQVDDHGHQNTGYGIGLALSRNIVQLHKGTVRAESGKDNITGINRTSFIVTLQKGHQHFDHELLKDAKTLNAAETDKESGPAQKTEQMQSNQSGRSSILIVEDNPELRHMIRDTFSSNYYVFEATNGEEGLHIATTQLPDIIISDVMMPKMDGIELCYRLKTDQRTSHIPVILLTAKSTQNDQVTGLETGADMYLTKPFSNKILELNVRNLLAAREKLKQLFQQQMSSFNFASNPAPVQLTALNTVEQEFLQRVIQIVEENMDHPDFGVDMLSRKVAMSAPILYKKIKAVSKMSVNDFVKSLRLKKAAQLLQEKQMTVYEVAFAVGYNDRKYFSQEFKKQFGKTPTEYANGVKDEQ